MFTTNYNKKTNYRANTYLEATIIKGLTFKTELSADYNNTKYTYYMPDYKFGVKNSDVRTSRWTQGTSKYWSWRNILTYNNKFDKHQINAMLGQEMSHNHYENQVTSATGFPSNSATDPSAGSNDKSQPVGYGDNTSLFSYFGRAFYSYDDRYLATFTLRRDGSSKFADGHRWGWFPSAALAWRISQEAFMKDNKVINNLKLRLGWGSTGNQNVENWAYMAMLSTYNTPWGVGVLNGNNANPKLKWETTRSWNAGFDLSLFDSRIDVVFDWYYKKTNDLLMRLDLPAFLGAGAGSGYGVASNPWGNVGSLRNSGIEVTVNTSNIEGKNFRWSSNIVFSLNRNKVMSLDTETGMLPRAFQVGSETATVTNPSTTMPRLYTSSYANNNNRVSDAYIEDGSYIRLQNVSLSYTLPRQWIHKIKLTNVKVYCNIQNLFTITKYDGYDPEVGSLWGDALKNGIDYNRYPSPRIYTFGLNVSF